MQVEIARYWPDSRNNRTNLVCLRHPCWTDIRHCWKADWDRRKCSLPSRCQLRTRCKELARVRRCTCYLRGAETSARSTWRWQLQRTFRYRQSRLAAHSSLQRLHHDAARRSRRWGTSFFQQHFPKGDQLPGCNLSGRSRPPHRPYHCTCRLPGRRALPLRFVWWPVGGPANTLHKFDFLSAPRALRGDREKTGPNWDSVFLRSCGKASLGQSQFPDDPVCRFFGPLFPRKPDRSNRHFWAQRQATCAFLLPRSKRPLPHRGAPCCRVRDYVPDTTSESCRCIAEAGKAPRHEWF